MEIDREQTQFNSNFGGQLFRASDIPKILNDGTELGAVRSWIERDLIPYVGHDENRERRSGRPYIFTGQHLLTTVLFRRIAALGIPYAEASRLARMVGPEHWADVGAGFTTALIAGLPVTEGASIGLAADFPAEVDAPRAGTCAQIVIDLRGLLEEVDARVGETFLERCRTQGLE